MALRLPHPDPGAPPTSGPLRYIWWLVERQPWRILRGSVVGTSWMAGLAVRPYLVSRAIDDGLRGNDMAALLRWSAAIVVAGMVLAYLGILRHRTMTFVREDATARSAGVLLRHLARLGAALPRRMAVGEVATVTAADITNTSHILTTSGPGVGAVAAFAVVAGLLWTVSPVLALLVLVGVPLSGMIVGPLLRRLERAESAYRHEQGQLTTRASDVVAGLRVLAGVGGRSLFNERYAGLSQTLLRKGYSVGAVSSWVEALTFTIPGCFLAAVVWLSARMAAEGTITIGEMVAVYGYVAVLSVPVWFMLEMGHQAIRARVAARRIVKVLSIEPENTGGGTKPAPGEGDLVDPASGLVVHPGRVVGVAADDPAAATALADRLGRFQESDVTWNGVPLNDIALDEVRAGILVADHESYLFAGTLREMLSVRENIGDRSVRAALYTASAEDVADSLPHGLDTPIGSRARTLSGGQRQRLRLARALLAEPEVLILIDPTSAVDAHTEARIAERLKARRATRTTVLVTTSPLLLGRADTVAFVRAGRVVATGTHTDLLGGNTDYRALVARDVDLDFDGAFA
jgi:ABC-type multidrug transport system fused ATPase/permease subunit